MLRAKGGDGVRQEVDGKPLGAGHAHVAALQALELAELLHQLAHFQLRLARVAG
ncbi:hypothetical protein D3C84_1319760 [compost metagenome]